MKSYIMKSDLIAEARRYVRNASDTLEKNAKIDETNHRYQDQKYVRAAGHYLWHAVLMALDAVFEVRKDRRSRVNIDEYQRVVGKRDKKLLSWLNSSYNVLHLYMGYDGELLKTISDEGVRLANDIIDRCAAMRK